MSALLDDIVMALGPRIVQRRPDGEIIAWCPFHPDGEGNPPHRPNLTIRPGNRGAKYVWACPVCSIGGTLLQLAARLREIGIMPRDSHRNEENIIVAYDYTDEKGQLLYQVVRKAGKVFPQRRRGIDGEWVWNLDGARRVPYRLPQLLAAGPAQWVFVPEGEKDADTLACLGLVTTTNSGGAGKWREEFGPYFAGRKVAILPDNDPPGQAHAQDVARKLAPHAAEVRIVNLPDLPPGGDVSDWLAQGHTADELAGLVEAAPAYEVSLVTDGAKLLDDVVAFIRRYVILSDDQAKAVGLWVIHTHVFDAAEATPYLSIDSPEKRSGKTRLLEVLSLLVDKPWLTARVTAAVLVRRLAKQAPTLLLDESDAAFSAEQEYAAALRGVLNAGYRRGGVTSLCVGQGAAMDYKDFPIFGPKAIAGIGKLPDTVADRAIPITLKRRAPNEPVSRFRWRDAQEEARPILDALVCWASANIDALAEARPDLPPELDDRAADVWEPLLAIADAAGGDWPETARKAARMLSAGERREDESLGVRLLTDIHTAFRNDKHLPTADLLKRLSALPESPWLLSPVTLAQHLKRFEVRPKVVRVGETTPRGYVAADFEDVWRRYIPSTPIPEKGATSATSATTATPKYNTDGENVADVADVAASGGMQEDDDADDNHQQDDDDTIPPEFTSQRHYLFALGAELSFPNIYERGGGIPAGRDYYLKAARYFSEKDVAKAIAVLEAMAAPEAATT